MSVCGNVRNRRNLLKNAARQSGLTMLSDDHLQKALQFLNLLRYLTSEACEVLQKNRIWMRKEQLRDWMTSKDLLSRTAFLYRLWYVIYSFLVMKAFSLEAALGKSRLFSRTAPSNDWVTSGYGSFQHGGVLLFFFLSVCVHLCMSTGRSQRTIFGVTWSATHFKKQGLPLNLELTK